MVRFIGNSDEALVTLVGQMALTLVWNNVVIITDYTVVSYLKMASRMKLMLERVAQKINCTLIDCARSTPTQVLSKVASILDELDDLGIHC